jgi:hypothetical protein
MSGVQLNGCRFISPNLSLSKQPKVVYTDNNNPRITGFQNFVHRPEF